MKSRLELDLIDTLKKTKINFSFSFSLMEDLIIKNEGKTEAVAHRCFVKKVFLEILQNLQENTCA